MHRRFAMIAGGALLLTGAAFAGAASAPQKAAAVSMVVYKSQT